MTLAPSPSLSTASASSHPRGPSASEWSAARDEAIRHLQSIIRMDTVNPPGNELQVARYLGGALTAQGIETKLFEPTPGRGTVVARLKGDGSRQPVLLLAHMDVVGVEREHWTADPFGAEIRDGYLYGRGAIDDKGMLAANLMTMLLLKRHVLDAGETLSRDVIFVANSDEEAGGDWGMGWLIANHPELIRAEFAINEGGRTRIVDGRPLYLAVQSTEKVSHVVTVVARGPGGHAAVPLAGNALFRLGRALAAISAHQEPVQLVPTTREFFSQLSRVWPRRDERAAMADLTSRVPRRMQRGGRVLARIPMFDAVLRAGISPVILQGGIRHNVIPTDATATLNVRTLPGQSLEGVLGRLRRVVNDALVELTVTDRGTDAPASDFGSPMFEAIAHSTKALDPSLAVVPYLSTGATDSARLRLWGVQAYGVLPFPLEQQDEERMHGHDERIPLASLEFGTKLIYGAIVRVSVVSAATEGAG